MSNDERISSAIGEIIAKVERMKLSCECGEMYSMADECTRLLNMLRHLSAASQSERTDQRTRSSEGPGVHPRHDYEHRPSKPEGAGENPAECIPSSTRAIKRYSFAVVEFASDLDFAFHTVGDMKFGMRESEHGAWVRAGDAITPSAKQRMNEYPDTEADGVVFCGKCGAKR